MKQKKLLNFDYIRSNLLLVRKKKNEELGRKSISEYKRAKKIPVVVVLDNVRSHNNVGSIFRSCDAFLVEEIILCGITATPPHRNIQKTALGATESVNWRYFNYTVEAVLSLKRQGWITVAIEQVEGAIELQNFIVEKDKKYALVFGHEVAGVSQEVIDICDAFAEIPQFGTKHSLNISVSAGIVLWEFSRKFIYEKK